jgi:hypothetical protein
VPRRRHEHQFSAQSIPCPLEPGRWRTLAGSAPGGVGAQALPPWGYRIAIAASD